MCYKVGFAANITHPQMLWTKMKATATLVKNVPSFAAWKSVSQWEQLMTKMTSSWGKALGPVWQTCFNYRRIVTEVMAVNGVAAGVAISISVAIVAITIFTRNLVTVALVMVCLSTMIGILLGLFWIFRFEIGAVEALSVSILVGLCTVCEFYIVSIRSRSSNPHR
jgi:PERQ amino acid-rich with GYF domain-containing protein